MINDLLKRMDVLSLIEDIKTSGKYNNKNINYDNTYFDVSNEMVLFIFYDALIKYKIIVKDMIYFYDYLENLNRLFKKINELDDISLGITRILCKIVGNKLKVLDIDSEEGRNTIINHIYNEYYVNGYFYHGFSYVYSDEIKEKGFIPEVYNNYYSKMIEIKNIFNKYECDKTVNKDFSKKSVLFTADFVKSCYYSLYSPMYFYDLLLNDLDKEINRDCYAKGDYDTSISYIKNYMSSHKFSDDDSKYVLDTIKEQWDLINNSDKKISILYVKRASFSRKLIEINEFIKDDSDLYEIVDRILSNKSNSISCNKPISNKAFSIITLDNFYEKKTKKEKIVEVVNEIKEEVSEDLNVSGKISLLFVLGSLFISLGVIIAIAMFIGG